MDSLFGTDRIDAIVEVLQSTPGWPADPVKDRQLVIMLEREKPGIDLREQILRWQAWELDKKKDARKRARPRSALTNWICNADQLRRGQPIGRGSRSQRSSGRGNPSAAVGGAPAAPGAFQGSGYRPW